ncbi:hypothetical protein CYMTET_32979, partial [Cymbomonas tetramitiformis]
MVGEVGEVEEVEVPRPAVVEVEVAGWRAGRRGGRGEVEEVVAGGGGEVGWESRRVGDVRVVGGGGLEPLVGAEVEKVMEVEVERLAKVVVDVGGGQGGGGEVKEVEAEVEEVEEVEVAVEADLQVEE